MPSICREIACVEWSNIRRFEHFLYLRDVVNNPFNVHPSHIQHEHGKGQAEAAIPEIAEFCDQTDRKASQPMTGLVLRR